MFELTPEEKAIPAELPVKPSEPIHYVWQRMKSKKGLKFHPAKRDAVATRIGEIARDQWKDSGKAILIFVRTIDDVKKVKAVLTDKKKGGVAEEQVQQLTGSHARARSGMPSPRPTRYSLDSAQRRRSRGRTGPSTSSARRPAKLAWTSRPTTWFATSRRSTAWRSGSAA